MAKNFKILKAIANDKRVEIIKALTRLSELSVNDLCKIIGVSQSSASQHLSILKDAKIVKTRRAAQTIFYSVCSPEAVKIINFLEVK